MRGRGTRVARAGDLLSFFQTRIGSVTEADLDRALRAVGGKRVTPVDLDHLVARAWRKVTGGPQHDVESLYELPSSLFDTDPNIALPPT